MKERPILFNGPMVRVLLEGRKTVTRRAIKIQPETLCPIKGWIRWRGLNWTPAEMAGECPYGQPGDRLWVRESFATPGNYDHIKPSDLIDTMCHEIVYRATELYPVYYNWRPSIHMPRWASRITLKITGVEVRPLWRMAVDDMIAEGVPEIPDTDDAPAVHPLTPFIRLWDSINARRGYPWSLNPWVWVINFKRIESEES